MSIRLAAVEMLPIEPLNWFAPTPIPPEVSGLPVAMWCGPRRGIIDGPMVKVELTSGQKCGSLWAVTIDDSPKVIGGNRIMGSSELMSVTQFVARNKAALLKVWSGELPAADFLNRAESMGRRE